MRAEPRDASALVYRSNVRASRTYLVMGNQFFDRGDIEAAERQYRRALMIDPRLTAAEKNLGLTSSARGEWDEAIAHFRRALDAEPALAAARYGPGRAPAEKSRTAQG